MISSFQFTIWASCPSQITWSVNRHLNCQFHICTVLWILICPSDALSDHANSPDRLQQDYYVVWYNIGCVEWRPQLSDNATDHFWQLCSDVGWSVNTARNGVDKHYVTALVWRKKKKHVWQVETCDKTLFNALEEGFFNSTQQTSCLILFACSLPPNFIPNVVANISCEAYIHLSLFPFSVSTDYPAPVPRVK